jgi:hypothetical protein
MCDRVTHLLKKSDVQPLSAVETAEIFEKTAKRPFWKANSHFSCASVRVQSGGGATLCAYVCIQSITLLNFWQVIFRPSQSGSKMQLRTGTLVSGASPEGPLSLWGGWKACSNQALNHKSQITKIILVAVLRLLKPPY